MYLYTFILTVYMQYKLFNPKPTDILDPKKQEINSSNATFIGLDKIKKSLYIYNTGSCPTPYTCYCCAKKCAAALSHAALSFFFFSSSSSPLDLLLLLSYA